MTQIFQEHQDKIKKERISGLTRSIRKDTKQINKLKIKQKLSNTPEEREKLQLYIKRLRDKVDMTLSAMTPDKFDKASLSQLAKALRVLTDRSVTAQGGAVKLSKEEKLNVNINVNNLDKKDLLELINKKSQEYGDE